MTSKKLTESGFRGLRVLALESRRAEEMALSIAQHRKGEEARARGLIARVSKMQSEEREALAETMLKRIAHQRQGTSDPSAGQSNRQVAGQWLLRRLGASILRHGK